MVVVKVVVVVEVVLFLPFLRGPSWSPLASSGSSCCRWSSWRREGREGMGGGSGSGRGRRDGGHQMVMTNVDPRSGPEDHMYQ